MGIYARDLVARFEGSPNFREVVHLRADSEIAQAIDSRSVLMVVRIRQDFSRAVSAGERAPVQLTLDGRSSNAALILSGYAQQIISGSPSELLHNRRGQPGAPASIVVSRSWCKPNPNALWSTVPSLVATGVARKRRNRTGRAVAPKRERGTVKHVRVA